MYQSVFFNKIADCRLRHMCFPVDFKTFFEASYFVKHLQSIASMYTRHFTLCLLIYVIPLLG